ncbi:hypothetical protein Vadar_016550 [Vaccinium darrowii]|uniref:Uncharacterized protein n=1 Tax=Vaccinium darrowii TaxID=229202 RepID=A0ACB7ZJY6_9ERIC|nr:hypothetical protein Vadar_016550 [Vaccinium darrowii]
MVCKVEEAMKKRQQEEQQQNYKGKGSQHQLVQKRQQIIQCNKGKASKFKRSSSNLEEDGASSAILLLACIALST